MTSLACGPAAEVFDILLQDSELAAQVSFTLVDVDAQALQYVRERLIREGLESVVRLERRNLLHLCIGRQQLELEPQHLIYSIGLIDYFDDRIVTRLQAWIHSCLAPGGRSILGNFHKSNPTRGLMDHLLDWRLIHRDEADMHRLAQAPALPRMPRNVVSNQPESTCFRFRSADPFVITTVCWSG